MCCAVSDSLLTHAVLPHAELEISPRFALKQGATRFA